MSKGNAHGEPSGKGTKFGPKSDFGKYMAKRWVPDSEDDSALDAARENAKVALKMFRFGMAGV